MYIYLGQCQTLVLRTINKVSLDLRTNVLIMDDTITLTPSYMLTLFWLVLHEFLYTLYFT